MTDDGKTAMLNAAIEIGKFYAFLAQALRTVFDPKLAAQLPEALLDSQLDQIRAALAPILETIAGLTRQIREHDRTLQQIARARYPVTALLGQVTGVGPVTALTYVLTIEDPSRFRKSRDVGPYLGLVPRRDASGERDPRLRITKAGDAALLVDRVLGLRDVRTWRQDEADGQAEYHDEQGLAWRKLDVAGLLAQPEFLQVGIQ